MSAFERKTDASRLKHALYVLKCEINKTVGWDQERVPDLLLEFAPSKLPRSNKKKFTTFDEG